MRGCDEGPAGGVTPLGFRSGATGGATGGARAWSAHRESMFPIATPTRSVTFDRVASREPAGARAPAAESDARDEAPSPSTNDEMARHRRKVISDERVLDEKDVG